MGVRNEESLFWPQAGRGGVTNECLSLDAARGFKDELMET